MILPLKTQLFDDSDITVDILRIGQEYCDARKRPENYKRSSYSLHFVLFGRGSIVTGDGTRYNVSKNQAFLLYENEEYSYKPDEKDPWSYIWIDFKGNNIEKLLDACGFDRNKICKRITVDFGEYIELMKKLYSAYDASELQQMRCSSYMLLILSKFIEQEQDKFVNIKSSVKKKTLREILIYINNNYDSPVLGVKKISEVCGISVSALKRLFAELLDMAPIEYISKYRISIACEKLQTANYDVVSTARFVGYDDVKYFSRVFKEKKGMTPTEYKERQIYEDPFEWIKAKGMFFR